MAYGFRPLGGRDADFREWIDNCAGGARHDVAQYVVVTPRAYVLFSDQAAPSVKAMMTAVAAHSVLPAQIAPLRYDIMGNVENRVLRADGYDVQLKPWTRLHSGQFVSVPGGSSATYVIPTAFVPDQGVTLTGLIELATDGRHVTALTIIGG